MNRVKHGKFTFLLTTILTLQLSIGSGFVSQANATPKRAFAEILKTTQRQLDTQRGSEKEILQNFAETLIDENISLDEVTAYAQSKLTPKEYAAYQKELKTSLKGLDSKNLTPDEFTSVLQNTLRRTQTKGLTWSSCTTLPIGVIMVVVSFVIAAIAFGKEKLDEITSSSIVKNYESKKRDIENTFSDTNTKLDDPQTYFDGKIKAARDSIKSSTSEISSANYRLKQLSDDLSDLQSRLRYESDPDRIDSLTRQINSISSEIDDAVSRISSEERNIKNQLNDIETFTNEKQRYADHPEDIAKERAILEIWYPKALDAAKKQYDIDLNNLPTVNEGIRAENAATAKSKKTLLIIAAIGSATGLAAIIGAASEYKYCN